MRRLVYSTIGILEFAIAGLLVSLGLQLPDSARIDTSFRGAQRVADRSGNQVRLLRRQVEDLRRPEMLELADRLQWQTRQVTAHLRSEAVDFETIRTLHEALGQVAEVLEALARTIDPAAIGKLRDGLGETAAFLDDKVIPAAEKAAAELEKSTSEARQGSQRLDKLLRGVPLDLKAVGLTEELPRSGGDLAKNLRDTRQLKETAKALRQAEKGVGSAVDGWPHLQMTLTKSAAALGAVSGQIDQALQHRKEYEDAMQHTISMTETVASMLPLLTREFNDQMADQDKGLAELEDGIGEVSASLPGYAMMGAGLVRTGRWITWLLALILIVHGFYSLGNKGIRSQASKSITGIAA